MGGVQELIFGIKVDPSKLPCLANWKRDYTMETILIELRRYVLAAQHVESRSKSCRQIHGSASAQEATAASRGNNVLAWLFDSTLRERSLILPYSGDMIRESCMIRRWGC